MADDEAAQHRARVADEARRTGAGQLESETAAPDADSLARDDDPSADPDVEATGRARASGDPDLEATGRARASADPDVETTGRAGASGDEAPSGARRDADEASAGGDAAKPKPWHRLIRKRAATEKKRKKAPWWELPVLIAVAIAVAVLIKTFLIQPFYIPSESMEKTLHGCPGCSGDRVLVNKLILDIRDPHPGDIVVFRAPDGWDEEPAPNAPSNPFVKGVRWFGQLIGFVPPDEKDLIKRVIAVGGQTVQCCDAQGRVQVSTHGTAGPWHSLDEPYIFEPSPWDPRDKPGHLTTNGSDQRTFGPITIPKGRLWVMGDHRNDSADSRFHCIQESRADHICGTSTTTVPVSKVIGKGVIIAWPPSRWRTLGTPSTFKHEALALPIVGGALVVLPVFGLRRRRRRR